MEGVVLYVTLVRVFIKNQGKYIVAFTVISYGRFFRCEYSLDADYLDPILL